MKKEGRMVIWPVNIDKEKSRSNGRITPRKVSVKDAKLDEMYAAADKLGLNPIAEKYKTYPNSWWERRGRLIVDKRNPKSDVAKKIAKQIDETRKKKK